LALIHKIDHTLLPSIKTKDITMWKMARLTRTGGLQVANSGATCASVNGAFHDASIKMLTSSVMKT